MLFSKLLLGMVHFLKKWTFFYAFFKFTLTSHKTFNYNNTSDVTVAQLDRATVF